MKRISSEKILVGGLQPLTMIDFPGRLASVVFTQGCNLRCRFCYNRTLLSDTTTDPLTWHSIIEFLKDRQGFIEGVVFSGGEPCLQPGILDAMREVRDLGYEIALHSNGFFPEVVEQAISERLLQFVAVDFKAPFSKYEAITRLPVDVAPYARLADLLVDSGVKYEYRTTVHPGLLTDADILQMADWLVSKKISNYAIQKFKHGEALDASLPPVPANCIKASTLLLLRSRFSNFTLRSDDSGGEVLLQKAA